MNFVSIIIPVRNGEDFICEAINSALEQGGVVGEIIVVDDGSTDQTVALVRAMNDARIQLLSRQDEIGGVSAVRNIGFRSSRGKWVMFLDADDRLLPGAVDGLMAAAKPKDVAVYGGYQRIDERGRSIGKRHWLKGRKKPSGKVLKPLLAGNFLVNGGVMIVRRDAFREIGGFDQRLAYAEDWLAWAQLAARGDFTYVPGLQVLEYRVHQSSVMMRKPLSLADCMPAVEAVFSDEKITSVLSAEEASTLKEQACGHMQAYCLSQAIRAKRYSIAIPGLAKALWQRPKSLPRLAKMSVAALVGL